MHQPVKKNVFICALGQERLANQGIWKSFLKHGLLMHQTRTLFQTACYDRHLQENAFYYLFIEQLLTGSRVKQHMIQSFA